MSELYRCECAKDARDANKREREREDQNAVLKAGTDARMNATKTDATTTMTRKVEEHVQNTKRREW